MQLFPSKPPSIFMNESRKHFFMLFNNFNILSKENILFIQTKLNWTVLLEILWYLKIEKICVRRTRKNFVVKNSSRGNIYVVITYTNSKQRTCTMLRVKLLNKYLRSPLFAYTTKSFSCSQQQPAAIMEAIYYNANNECKTATYANICIQSYLIW